MIMLCIVIYVVLEKLCEKMYINSGQLINLNLEAKHVVTNQYTGSN